MKKTGGSRHRLAKNASRPKGLAKVGGRELVSFLVNDYSGRHYLLAKNEMEWVVVGMDEGDFFVVLKAQLIVESREAVSVL
jgi:hypothetical protein